MTNFGKPSQPARPVGEMIDPRPGAENRTANGEIMRNPPCETCVTASTPDIDRAATLEKNQGLWNKWLRKIWTLATGSDANREEMPPLQQVAVSSNITFEENVERLAQISNGSEILQSAASPFSNVQKLMTAINEGRRAPDTSPEPLPPASRRRGQESLVIYDEAFELFSHKNKRYGMHTAGSSMASVLLDGNEDELKKLKIGPGSRAFCVGSISLIDMIEQATEQLDLLPDLGPTDGYTVAIFWTGWDLSPTYQLNMTRFAEYNIPMICEAAVELRKRCFQLLISTGGGDQTEIRGMKSNPSEEFVRFSQTLRSELSAVGVLSTTGRAFFLNRNAIIKSQRDNGIVPSEKENWRVLGENGDVLVNRLIQGVRLASELHMSARLEEFIRGRGMTMRDSEAQPVAAAAVRPPPPPMPSTTNAPGVVTPGAQDGAIQRAAVLRAASPADPGQEDAPAAGPATGSVRGRGVAAGSAALREESMDSAPSRTTTSSTSALTLEQVIAMGKHLPGPLRDKLYLSNNFAPPRDTGSAGVTTQSQPEAEAQRSTDRWARRSSVREAPDLEEEGTGDVHADEALPHCDRYEEIRDDPLFDSLTRAQQSLVLDYEHFQVSGGYLWNFEDGMCLVHRCGAERSKEAERWMFTERDENSDSLRQHRLTKSSKGLVQMLRHLPDMINSSGLACGHDLVDRSVARGGPIRSLETIRQCVKYSSKNRFEAFTFLEDLEAGYVEPRCFAAVQGHRVMIDQNELGLRQAKWKAVANGCYIGPVCHDTPWPKAWVHATNASSVDAIIDCGWLNATRGGYAMGCPRDPLEQEIDPGSIRDNANLLMYFDMEGYRMSGDPSAIITRNGAMIIRGGISTDLLMCVINRHNRRIYWPKGYNNAVLREEIHGSFIRKIQESFKYEERTVYPSLTNLEREHIGAPAAQPKAAMPNADVRYKETYADIALRGGANPSPPASRQLPTKPTPKPSGAPPPRAPASKQPANDAEDWQEVRARPRGRPDAPVERIEPNNPLACLYCHRVGHFIRECPFYRQGQASAQGDRGDPRGRSASRGRSRSGSVPMFDQDGDNGPTWYGSSRPSIESHQGQELIAAIQETLPMYPLDVIEAELKRHFTGKDYTVSDATLEAMMRRMYRTGRAPSSGPAPRSSGAASSSGGGSRSSDLRSTPYGSAAARATTPGAKRAKAKPKSAATFSVLIEDEDEEIEEQPALAKAAPPKRVGSNMPTVSAAAAEARIGAALDRRPAVALPAAKKSRGQRRKIARDAQKEATGNAQEPDPPIFMQGEPIDAPAGPQGPKTRSVYMRRCVRPPAIPLKIRDECIEDQLKLMGRSPEAHRGHPNCPFGSQVKAIKKEERQKTAIAGEEVRCPACRRVVPIMVICPDCVAPIDPFSAPVRRRRVQATAGWELHFKFPERMSWTFFVRAMVMANKAELRDHDRIRTFVSGLPWYQDLRTGKLHSSFGFTNDEENFVDFSNEDVANLCSLGRLRAADEPEQLLEALRALPQGRPPMQEISVEDFPAVSQAAAFVARRMKEANAAPLPPPADDPALAPESDNDQAGKSGDDDKSDSDDNPPRRRDGGSASSADDSSDAESFECY